MNPIEALDFAIGVSRHRANKLRGVGQMSRAVLDRIRQHDEAADALQGLRDQVATRAGQVRLGAIKWPIERLVVVLGRTLRTPTNRAPSANSNRRIQH